MGRSWIMGLVISFMLIGTHHVLRAQETSKETVPNVPALTEFHKVIYKIWHTAWPNKDYDALTAFLPEVEKGTAAIVSAELPGETIITGENGLTFLGQIVSLNYQTS